MNQMGQPRRPEIPVKDFAETVGISPVMVLPFEPQLYGAAANNGQMLMEVQPRSQTAEGIQRLAEVATGRAVPEMQRSVLPFFTFLKGRKQA